MVAIPSSVTDLIHFPLIVWHSISAARLGSSMKEQQNTIRNGSFSQMPEIRISACHDSFPFWLPLIFSSLRITSSARNSAVPDSTEGSALNLD